MLSKRITRKQLNLALLLTATLCFTIWQGFVYYAAKDPLPAGTCVSGYGECAASSTFWGNIVWGGMGLFVILVPGWVVVITAIVLGHFISRRRGNDHSAKSL